MKIRNVAALGLLAIALLQTTASAQYEGDTGPLAVSDTTVPPGDPLTVSGSGFAPGSDVTITIESAPRTLANVTAGSNGRISAIVRIPADVAAGTHTLKATGVTPDGATLVLSTSITVAGSGSAQLAATGAGTILPLSVAGLLLIVGAVTVWATRRRART